MVHKNPFLFGDIVSGDYFTDRKAELELIKRTVDALQNIILISPRRYGKSSLIAKAIQEITYDSIVIDLELINSELELANLLIAKLTRKYPLEKIKQFVKAFSVKPTFSFTPDQPEFKVSYEAGSKSVDRYCLDAFNLPNTIANIKRPLVIVFDEFQEIRRISNDLEKKLRGIFQHHNNVCYVFIGSNKHMITDIFQNYNNPFYNFGKHIQLQRIPYTDFFEYLKNRFSVYETVTDKLLDNILELTQCHPYYTQKLAHEIYDLLLSGILISEDLIAQATSSIVNNQNAEYCHWWSERNNTERKILIGLAENKYGYTTQEFLKTYELNSPSTVSSSVSRMYDKGILEQEDSGHYIIEDLFYKQWIIYRRKNL